MVVFVRDNVAIHAPGVMDPPRCMDIFYLFWVSWLAWAMRNMYGTRWWRPLQGGLFVRRISMVVDATSV